MFAERPTRRTAAVTGFVIGPAADVAVVVGLATSKPNTDSGYECRPKKSG